MNKHYATIAGKLLLPAVLLIVFNLAAGSIHVQLPPDQDGVDTDGNGTVDDDHVGIHLAAGDGFVKMADGRSMYVFGFQDVSGYVDEMVMHYGELGANAPGPTLVFREGQKVYLTLTNVGMQVRPDLFDPHTVHWHGFPEAAPFFDGVPDASVSVNMGASIAYFYNVLEPGTYMYHCHVEATEHMQMGMLANLHVLPKQNMLPDGTDLDGFTHHTGHKYIYNDGDGSTFYDVEFPLQMSGFDPLFHDASESVQPLPFSTMHDTYPLLNGRGYPDTVDPAPIANLNDGRLAQKMSSLVTAEQGQRVLLRLSNLSTTEYYTVAILGIPMKVVGTGARQLRGPGGEDLSYETASVTLGGGENADVLLDTTDVEPGTYFLYSTNLNQLSNDAEDFGGMMTEIVINEPGATSSDTVALLPATGSLVDLDTAPTFTWSYTGAAATFGIEIATSAAGLGDPETVLYLPKKNVSGSSYTLTGSELSSLRKYLNASYADSFAWRVVGKETLTGVYHRSEPNTVDVSIEEILPVSPADGAFQTVYSPPSLAFQYTGTDLESFVVEMSDQPDFQGRTASTSAAGASPIVVGASTWKTVKSWFRKDPNPTNWVIWWRVVGSSADGTDVLASAGRRLKLNGGTISLTSPDNNVFASLGGEGPIFTWLDNNAPWVDPKGLSGKYVLQVSATSDFDSRRTWQSTKRGSSEQSATIPGSEWSRLDRKLKVDPGTGSVTIYWRVLAFDQDMLLGSPSAAVRTIRLTR